MKRILTMVLCIVMMITTATAFADELKLSTKLQRQIQHDGNGEKGKLTVTGNADAAEHPLLSTIQNAEYSILRNASGEQWHFVVYQAEKDDEGKELNQFNKTELYRSEKSLYFRSDFLPNEVFQLPEEISMILPDGMTNPENPSLNSAMLSLMNLNDAARQKQDTAVEKYSRMLDKWIDGFQGIPEQIRSEDGSILMKLTCVVPAEEVCKEIATLVTAAAADPEMESFFSQILTGEQKAVYLNPNLGYYYMEAMAGAAIRGDIQYTRIKTALGETVSKEMVLPINPDITGYDILKIRNNDDTQSWTLQGGKGIVQLFLPENIETILDGAEYQFNARFIRINPDRNSEEANLALSMQIRKNSELSFDQEKERNHEIITYSTDIRRDTSSLPEGVEDADIDPFDDMTAELTLHYSGKSGPNAATKLETTLKLNQGELKLQAEGEIRTTSTWPFVPFDVSNALPLEKLSENEKTAAGIRLLKNADEAIVRKETEQEQ